MEKQRTLLPQKDCYYYQSKRMYKNMFGANRHARDSGSVLVRVGGLKIQWISNNDPEFSL